jgi:multidrug transporter EmrE-like cation transporter
MSFLRTILLFLPTLTLSLIGQVLLKKGVMQSLAGAKPSVGEFVTLHLLRLLATPFVIAGVVLCGMGALCYLYVLSAYDLSKALPILGAMAYIAIFFVGRLYMKEQASWVNFAGIVTIIVGLYLISMKTGT